MPPIFIDTFVDTSRPAFTSDLTADIFARPMTPAPAPFVYINGWSGTGKHAVAECLALLMGQHKALLIDVHQITKGGNPGHPDFDPAARSTDRLARMLSRPASLGKLAVLADCAPDTPAGRGAVRAYEAAAAQSGRMFVPVTLLRTEDGVGFCGFRAPEDAAGLRKPLLGRGPSRKDELCPAGLARDRLTLSIAPSLAHEAALMVLEHVSGLVVTRDIELCSAVTTPLECQEPEWKRL